MADEGHGDPEPGYVHANVNDDNDDYGPHARGRQSSVPVMTRRMNAEVGSVELEVRIGDVVQRLPAFSTDSLNLSPPGEMSSVLRRVRWDATKNDGTVIVENVKDFYVDNQSYTAQPERSVVAYLLRGGASLIPLRTPELEWPDVPQEDHRMCTVCFMRSRKVLFMPCKHMLCCISCANTLIAGNRPCPTCSLQIGQAVEVVPHPYDTDLKQ